MSGELRIAELALLGQRTLASSEDAIAQVTELVQRLSGVDITVLSEVRDGTYRFAGLEAVPALTLVPGDAIPFTSSLCSRVHLGLAPAVVPEMRDEPALWDNWLALKEGLGVDWDIRAFCTTEVRLPDGSLYGTLCLHHREPRAFSDDEQALMAVLARIRRRRDRARTGAHRAGRGREAADAGRGAAGRADRGARARAARAAAGHRRLRRGHAGRRARARGRHAGPDPARGGALGATLDDLSYLTRLETAVRLEEPDRVDLAEAIGDAIARFAPLAAAAGTTLRSQTDAAVALVPRGRLEQVLVNLTRNALRAVAEEGSTVTLFAHAEGQWAIAGVETTAPAFLPARSAACSTAFIAVARRAINSAAAGSG